MWEKFEKHLLFTFFLNKVSILLNKVLLGIYFLIKVD